MKILTGNYVVDLSVIFSKWHLNDFVLICWVCVRCVPVASLAGACVSFAGSNICIPVLVSLFISLVRSVFMSQKHSIDLRDSAFHHQISFHVPFLGWRINSEEKMLYLLSKFIFLDYWNNRYIVSSSVYYASVVAASSQFY